MPLGAVTGSTRANHPQLDRRVCNIGCAHRKTIHGCVGKRRHMFTSHHVLRQHQTGRKIAGNLHRAKRGNPVEHTLLRFAERDHLLDGIWHAACRARL